MNDAKPTPAEQARAEVEAWLEELSGDDGKERLIARLTLVFARAQAADTRVAEAWIERDRYRADWKLALVIEELAKREGEVLRERAERAEAALREMLTMADKQRAELLAAEAEVARLREECLRVIESEPEFPGPIPHRHPLGEMPLDEALRQAVRMTKRNIADRIRALAGSAPVELDKPFGGRGFKQAFLQLWGHDQDPARDAPREAFGILQGSLSETIAFVSAALRSHWNGVCGCQKPLAATEPKQ